MTTRRPGNTPRRREGILLPPPAPSHRQGGTTPPRRSLRLALQPGQGHHVAIVARHAQVAAVRTIDDQFGGLVVHRHAHDQRAGCARTPIAGAQQPGTVGGGHGRHVTAVLAVAGVMPTIPGVLRNTARHPSLIRTELRDTPRSGPPRIRCGSTGARARHRRGCPCRTRPGCCPAILRSLPAADRRVVRSAARVMAADRPPPFAPPWPVWDICTPPPADVVIDRVTPRAGSCAST